jgi:hypothetical protein
MPVHLTAAGFRRSAPLGDRRLTIARHVRVTGGAHAGERGRIRFVRRVSRRAVVSLHSGRFAVIALRHLVPTDDPTA